MTVANRKGPSVIEEKQAAIAQNATNAIKIPIDKAKLAAELAK